MSTYPNTRGRARRAIEKSVRVRTHSIVLSACLDAVPGDVEVLEHGMGMGSTPLIHAFPRLKKMLSFETEPQWMTCDTCKDEETKKKHVILNPTPEQFEEKTKEVFHSLSQCVVFVDGPGFERGAILKMAMANGSPYIVEHDAECFSLAEIQERRENSQLHGYSAWQYVGENPETAFYVKLEMPLPVIDQKLVVSL